MSLDLTWIEEGRVAACAAPASEADLEQLRESGISLVVNLLERAHPAGALEPHGLRELHLPVRDFTAPSPEQIERAVGAIESAVSVGERVVVHCTGGLGRTGVIVACWLVSRGASPADAAARVRELRPGSIETGAQVEAVTRYGSDDGAT